jgi:hypothetical protein
MACLLRHAPTGRRHDTGTHPMRHAGLSTAMCTSAPFVLIGVFVVLVMAVTAALPAHMVSLLRESGLSEAWAITGACQHWPGAGVRAGACCTFFEHHVDVHMSPTA